MKVILQTTFRQAVTFPEPPPRHIRRALLAAGFRYTGAYWHLTTGTASPIGTAQLEDILGVQNRNNPDSGIAPTNLFL